MTEVRPRRDVHCFVDDSIELPPTGSGALSGARIAVKDMYAVAGRTSSFGHAAWRETHAPASATAPLVRRLLDAGGRVVGITKLDQLAYSLIGNAGEGTAPVNVFAPDCYCGGSSSGSASAVAADLADLGVGSDTAGSIRVPAAACGLYSLRPTHGLVLLDGALPLARTLDVAGFIAREPRLLLDALTASSDGREQRRAVEKVLLPSDLRSVTASASWEAIASAASELAAESGAELQHVDAAWAVDSDVGDLFARVQGREIWWEHGAWVDANSTRLAPDVQARLARCRALSSEPQAVIEADLQAREQYRLRVAELLGDGGVLVLPILHERGPLRTWTDEALLAFRLECFRLTAPSSLAGLPQAVLPRDAGTSVGLLGPARSDRLLLELASTLS